MKPEGPAGRLRRGAIDQIDGLEAMDLVAFNDSVNPWNNAFVETGFRPGPAYFRDSVAERGFMELGAIADVGSGYGRWSMFLGEVNASVRGFERNAEAVKLSGKLARYFQLPNVEFSVADARQLPADDASFDGVWCYNGLHLLPRADALKEMHRILKPGGRLFLGAYNGLGHVLQKFFQGYRNGGLKDPLTSFALQSLSDGSRPEANGGSYAARELVEPVLKHFGFVLDGAHAIEEHMNDRPSDCDRFRDQLQDVSALADRIRNEPGFADEFSRYPEIATRYPINLDIQAIKP